MPCSTAMKRRAWSRFATTALSVTSKQMSPGIRAGVIEAIDHELQEFGIAERLAGDVDRNAAARRQLHAAAAERRQHRLHHPAVDVRHQAVALGGADEFGRRRAGLAVLGLHAHEHLERRAAHAAVLRACTMGW